MNAHDTYIGPRNKSQAFCLQPQYSCHFYNQILRIIFKIFGKSKVNFNLPYMLLRDAWSLTISSTASSAPCLHVHVVFHVVFLSGLAPAGKAKGTTKSISFWVFNLSQDHRNRKENLGHHTAQNVPPLKLSVPARPHSLSAPTATATAERWTPSTLTRSYDSNGTKETRQ